MLKSDIIAVPLLISGILLTLSLDDFGGKMLGIGCMMYGVMILLKGDAL